TKRVAAKKPPVKKVASTSDKGTKIAGNQPGPPGMLRLVTVPWTDVYFEGRKLGQTPLVDVRLPSGKVTLRLVNREAGIDRKIVVDIKPGRRNTYRRNLY
ncbi:MAG: hypothetical protein D6806_08955, partial [Deltaproteobacteria bacterium]